MNRSQKRAQEKLARKAALAAGPDLAQLVRDGVAHHLAGRVDQAAAYYARVLDNAPDHPDANHLSGLIAHQRGESDKAIDLMSRALRAAPQNAAIHNNLGLALQAAGRREDAAQSYRRALVLQPAYVEAMCNLGNILLDNNQPEDAANCYRKAIAINPDFPGAHYNLGNALRRLQRFDEAIAAFEAAIALRPDYAKAHNNLGDALKEVSRLDEAMAHFRAACESDPDSPAYLSSFIFMQDFDAGVDLRAQQAERRTWNDRFAAPLAARAKPHDNDRDPERRLRIGYVSSDFREHSAAQGFAPLIFDHDRENFEIHCYACNTRTDAMTEALRAAAEGWRDVSMLDDEALAALVREDGIDILVDLSGHSDGHRLLAFARKPAPVQATGIGHHPPGLEAIDYRLMTKHCTMPEEEPLFPEQPAYLTTYFGYLPPAEAPEPTEPPCLAGNGLTFGSLNRLYKISDEARALWSSILHAVPGSRLLIKFSGLDGAEVRARMEAAFAGHGIAADRLILLGGSSRREHLATYNRIDIALDTFPTPGGITTMESLWMGVPVLGLYRDTTIAARSIRRFCAPIGLDDWIADSPEDYLRLAVAWAGRGEDLAALRREMRARLNAAYCGFNREVEAAYRIMWRRWCRGEAPSPIDISGGQAA